jgi:hypothetical protein
MNNNDPGRRRLQGKVDFTMMFAAHDGTAPPAVERKPPTEVTTLTRTTHRRCFSEPVVGIGPATHIHRDGFSRHQPRPFPVSADRCAAAPPRLHILRE